MTATTKELCYYSGAVKKTCQACVTSKVKCCGGTPCSRCIKRGDECSYQLEQKRGRRPNTDLVSAPIAKRVQQRLPVFDTASPLPVYPRRLFRVLFSLFKFHSTRDNGGGYEWFAAKFRVLAPLVANDAFESWLRTRFPLSSHIPTFSLVNLASMPFLHSRSHLNQTHLGTIQVCTITSVCQCSPELGQYLGYDTTGSNFPYDSAICPTVLPFGGNVLAQIANTDSLVLQFVREAFLCQGGQLVDFPMTLRAIGGTTVRCLMSWKQVNNECWFDFYAPSSSTSITPFLSVIPLPDLELGPWIEIDWLSSLCKWIM
ncbi:hypothetical protein BASA81_004411 [Batrachochytrium salamandrivorans]|nr:hypothetical protein BASA81_004411 [Batrachochytrium salamandrivorans]